MAAPMKEIEKILADMRHAINNRNYTLVPRKKNLETLARLGILMCDAVEEIYGLTPSDYDSGPKNDRDRPGSDCLWVFKKSISGTIIYIKFKVKYQENGDVMILSFHIDHI